MFVSAPTLTRPSLLGTGVVRYLSTSHISYSKYLSVNDKSFNLESFDSNYNEGG